MQNSIKNKQELLAAILANKAQIESYGVKRLGIFGSFVRNEATENSDVDFYIEFYPALKNFDNYMDLAELLKTLVGRNIEIITPQSLSKYIGPAILKEVEYVALAA